MWFVAVLLYRSSSDAPDYSPLYEETFLLLEAGSADEAEKKARAYARGGQVAYENEFSETISWELVRVVDVRAALYPPADESELYARFFKDYAAYESWTSSAD